MIGTSSEATLPENITQKRRLPNTNYRFLTIILQCLGNNWRVLGCNRLKQVQIDFPYFNLFGKYSSIKCLTGHSPNNTILRGTGCPLSALLRRSAKLALLSGNTHSKSVIWSVLTNICQLIIFSYCTQQAHVVIKRKKNNTTVTARCTFLPPILL